MARIFHRNIHMALNSILSDLKNKNHPKMGAWKTILQFGSASHFKTLVFTLLFAFSTAESAEIRIKCKAALTGQDVVQDNAALEKRYNKIDSEIVDSENLTYKQHVEDYFRAIRSPNPFWGYRLMLRDEFAQRMTEKMLLLTQREPLPKAQAKIDIALDKIDLQQKKLPHWKELQTEPRAIELLEKSGPEIDKRNVKKKSDIDFWHDAMKVAIRLAKSDSNLTEARLIDIVVQLQGYSSENYIRAPKLVEREYINFMYTKDSRGRQVHLPENTFIPGPAKREALRHLFNWLRNSRGEVHPVIRAAKARQMIVSIHPLEDGNGRLARIVANYVLMQEGYPPAYILRGTEANNTSVALFPLKDFKDQISPEESIQIMIEGVARSQQFLLGTKK